MLIMSQERLLYERPSVDVLDFSSREVICQSVVPNGLEGTGIDPLDI